SVIDVDAPPASGPSVHVRRFWSPLGVSVQPDVGDGGSKRNGTSPANVASSDAPGACICGARFVTINVHVVGVSSVTGFGDALIVTVRSTRPAGTTTSRSWPGTVFVPSETVKRTVCVPTLAPICGAPVNRPAELSAR